MTTRLVSVLHHELVHAAWHAEAPGVIQPAWLNEGLAEWLEARALGQRGIATGQRRYLVENFDRLFSLAQLSMPAFGHLGPDAAGVAYLQSFAFVEYLARTQGERGLRRLCRELVRTGKLDRAVRRVYRKDLGRLEQGFLDELRSLR